MPKQILTLLKITLTVAILVLALFGLMYFLNPQALTTEIKDSNTQTAEWKTYTNNEGKFSLEYPSNWKLDDQSNKGSLDYGPTKNVTFTGPEGFIMLSYGTGFGGMCEQGYEKIQIGGEQFDVCHSVEIQDGIGGEFDPKDKNHMAEFWSISGKLFGNYGLGFFATANAPYLSNRDTILKILSTFKFTDSQNQTANWKTYTNTQEGYEIKYPSDWAFREYPDTKTGAGFRPLGKPNEVESEFININDGGRGLDYCNMSFSEYVKKAAPLEIENFEDLNSIEKVENFNGVEMYQITWNYSDHQGNKKISLPFTYFGSENQDCRSLQAALGNSAYSDIYNAMIKTFKFTK